MPATALQPALANPRRATPAAIQALQARYGNQAVQRLALKRQALLIQKINSLCRLSLAVLAYAEVYKLKGESFVPGLLKLKDGSLKAFGPSLAIQLETLFRQMETLKALHRRLEVHAGQPIAG